jgi:putative phage-type endonuclease
MNDDRQSWLQERKKGIGGSDASALMGLNKWTSNIDLWEIKTGRKEQEDISEKDVVKYGTDAERHLIELFKLDFADQYEVMHKDYDLRVHPKYDFIIGSLDGELTERATGRKGILEIKTTNIMNYNQLKDWDNTIPQNYFYQTLHYLLVTEYDFVVLKAQLKFKITDDLKLETRHYYFDRAGVENLISNLLEKEIYFWKVNVMQDIRPPRILPNV